MTCYLAEHYIAEFKARFAYAFSQTGYSGLKPRVEIVPFREGRFKVAGIQFGGDVLEIETALVPHGHVQTAVFRIGSFAYATDFKVFTPELCKLWRAR